MFQIIRLTPSNNWYYPESLELGKLAGTKSYTPHTKMSFPLGASRLGGPIADLPEKMQIPTGMHFAALLNLHAITKHDLVGLLPNTGYLFFFIGGYGDEGAVIYSDCDSSKLHRHFFDHDKWFWDGCLIEKSTSEIEDLSSRYIDVPGEGRQWDAFAGSEMSKIYGIYTHCQKSESEIIEISSSSKILLLQIGEDYTGEGVWSVLIEKVDLTNRNFSNCSFDWGQS